jgi:hypothetical protein
MIFFVGIEGTSPSIARRQAGVAELPSRSCPKGKLFFVALFVMNVFTAQNDKTRFIIKTTKRDLLSKRDYSAKRQNAIYHQNVITAQIIKTRFINKTRFIIKSTKRVFQFISNSTFCRIGH